MCFAHIGNTLCLQADSQNSSPQHPPRSSSSPGHTPTPKVIRVSQGALRGQGAVVKVKGQGKGSVTQMKSMLQKSQGQAPKVTSGSASASTSAATTNGTTNSKFEKKYRRIKKIVKDMIFVSKAQKGFLSRCSFVNSCLMLRL